MAHAKPLNRVDCLVLLLLRFMTCTVGCMCCPSSHHGSQRRPLERAGVRRCGELLSFTVVQQQPPWKPCIPAFAHQLALDHRSPRWCSCSQPPPMTWQR